MERCEEQSALRTSNFAMFLILESFNVGSVPRGEGERTRKINKDGRISFAVIFLAFLVQSCL